jgi:DinB superfamily
LESWRKTDKKYELVRTLPGAYMSEYLAWSLDRAREHTLALVADVPPEAMQLQAVPDERHPAWILGHLLLADSYLLSLLGAQPLPDDFSLLLKRYGPAAAPNGETRYDTKQELIDRLRGTNVLRVAQVSAMQDRDLVSPMPDTVLAQVQPTIGHHLQSLVFHEGYHAGQLSSWRKTHGLTAVRWTLGPQ